MSKGLLIPMTVNPRGGLTTIESSEMLNQIIRLGVTPASSNHPWNQTLAPREELIFSIADEITGGEVVAHIYDLFEELQRLNMAMLSRKHDAVKLDMDASSRGEIEVVVTYTDLEDNESREVRFKGAK